MANKIKECIINSDKESGGGTPIHSIVTAATTGQNIDRLSLDV